MMHTLGSLGRSAAGHAACSAFIAGAAMLAASAAVAAASAPFTVKSSLAATSVLPHRIHWLAIPSLPASKVREVDFAIDGKLKWIEHHRPYSYGYDGNYLVTTWLRPGPHLFTVTAFSKDGTRASTSSTARVPSAPPAPPSELAGTWSRMVTKAEAGTSGRAGRWTITIDAVGWRILDPTGHGAFVDVAYLAHGLVEARGGIATGYDNSREGNVWCEEPFQPVRYRWTTTAESLTLVLAGPKRCGGESAVWSGSWSRV